MKTYILRLLFIPFLLGGCCTNEDEPFCKKFLLKSEYLSSKDTIPKEITGIGNAQIEKYDFNNWSGKNSIPRCNIIISRDIIKTYNMILSPGSDSCTIICKMPFSNTDTLNRGRLFMKVYDSPQDAHLALFYYLEDFAIPPIPQKCESSIIVADNIFYLEIEGRSWLGFTSFNVFVSLYSSTLITRELALIISSSIQKATACDGKNGNVKPTIKFD